MEIEIPRELIQICKEIEAKHLSSSEWANIESSDMFQTDYIDGGFDATEGAFCFSYYTAEGEEFWFQVTLDEIAKINAGVIKKLLVRVASH